MAVQGPFKKYFSLQNWILKFQKWQKVGGSLSFSCREWGYLFTWIATMPVKGANSIGESQKPELEYEI